MNTTPITIESLFLQLGLPHTEAEIAKFIQTHRLGESQHIVDAPFWTESQQSFIHEAWLEDADWVQVIDELDAHLHYQ